VGERLSGGVEHAKKDCTSLGRQASADHEHAVVVVKDVLCAGRVPSCGLLCFGFAVHLAPAAHDRLDMSGGAGAGNAAQLLLGPTRRRAFAVSRPGPAGRRPVRVTDPR
jgi:hypothetical protein